MIFIETVKVFFHFLFSYNAGLPYPGIPIILMFLGAVATGPCSGNPKTNTFKGVPRKSYLWDGKMQKWTEK